MDYNRVALFVQVARLASFTAAGVELGLPKSSISRSVARLEKDLGVRLLTRTTRKLTLTGAGQAYYDSVRGMFHSLDEADAAVRELGAEPRGVVRISAPFDLGADLTEELVKFTRKYPAIRLEFAFSSRRVDLTAEGFDLAIRAGKLEDSSLVVRRIGVTEAALFASPAYLRRRGRPKTPDDLPAHDWVLLHAHAGRGTITLSGPEGTRAIEVQGALVGDDMMFCRAAAEAGAGIAFLPLMGVVRAKVEGRLEQVLPDWFSSSATLNVVMPSARYIPTRVALVRDMLVAYLTRELQESQRQCGAARKAQRAAQAASP